MNGQAGMHFDVRIQRIQIFSWHDTILELYGDISVSRMKRVNNKFIWYYVRAIQ